MPDLPNFPPLAGNVRDAAVMIGRSRNYIYDLHARGLLPIHTDPLRPRVRTIIYSELLAAIRTSANPQDGATLPPMGRKGVRRHSTPA